MTDSRPAAEPDVIEHGADRTDRADRERWSWSGRLPGVTRRRVSVVLAFTVGVVAGMVGWYRWDSAAEVRAERSEISLVAWLSYSGLNYLGPEEVGQPIIESYVRLHNAGSLPVQIERLELAQPGLTVKDSLPESLQLAPGKTGTASVRSELHCRDWNERQPPTLVAQVRPASGSVQERRITLSQSDLGGMTSGACGTDLQTTLNVGLSYAGVGATVSGTGPGATLRVPVSAAAFGRPTEEFLLTGVAAQEPSLDVGTQGLPVRVANDPPSELTMTWRVTDCGSARDLHAGNLTTVDVTGHREGSPRKLTATSDMGPELLLVLSRFIDRVCS